MNRISNLIKIHLILILILLPFVSYFFGVNSGKTFALGAFVVWLNWWLLIFTWSWVLGKKSIALAASVIVMKYALLAFFSICIIRQPWLVPSWVVGGVFTIVPAVLFLAWYERLEKQK
ncbi:MAG: hypothetical protein K1X29_01100 [Bdellovibrionales bacterium]|nr:hypothetical protein [Bdellovibrionales bacterium]